jgi:hypothetical protein
MPTTKRRKAHKACPEDRQGITLVLVARHEILMFPFERIRDVDRPARQEQAVLLRQLARYGGASAALIRVSASSSAHHRRRSAACSAC